MVSCFGLIFHSEDGGSKVLGNVGGLPAEYNPLHPTRLYSSTYKFAKLSDFRQAANGISHALKIFVLTKKC
jgi:hypothetical protein